ncbi:hypothetical protein ACFS6H_06030 [Terrimonas rubra]|jgi:hypothetical protein|uniref:Anti-sigma factor n=1 Tax=Terrimonas rubra TaxID=1035890 RepID=A0ABW6A1U4_9BACT
MDNLKNFLEDHKDEMDFESPSPEVWQKLNKPLKKAPVISIRKILYAATAACVLLIAGLLYVMQEQKEPGPGEMAMAGKATIQSPDLLTNEQAVLMPDTTTDLSLARTTAEQTLKKANRSKQNTGNPIDREVQTVVQSIDKNFNKLLNAQLRNINQTPIYAESKDMFGGFKNQYRQLEIAEKQLKADIVNFGMEEQLLQQLIFINQQKLNLLKSLQVEINKVNNNIPPQQKNKQQYLKM